MRIHRHESEEQQVIVVQQLGTRKERSVFSDREAAEKIAQSDWSLEEAESYGELSNDVALFRNHAVHESN